MRGKGLFVGLRVLALIAVSSLVTSSWAATYWHEKVLHSFGSEGDGHYPISGLVSDAAGNLYGTTENGGTYNYGTVFELSPTPGGGWTETVLHSSNNDGKDGYYPTAGVVLDAAGNLYGTTIYGSYGGTVFELSPDGSGGWTETVLHGFGMYGDGRYPHGILVFDAAGNIYGTTDGGGIYCDLYQGCGTVFELSPNGSGGWTETVLHSFDLGTGGEGPLAGVILDAAGNLYGTTYGGGTNNPGGTVFELSPDGRGGWTETVLHSFGPKPDGTEPWGGLIFDGKGNLYGTTSRGGADDVGTVFEVSPDGSGGWTETVLHSFGNGMDGFEPLNESLIFDAAGNLYGTTSQGGDLGYGTVFEVSPNGSGGWTETVLHNFDGADGWYPFAGLTFDATGNLFGTTNSGGAYSEGNVFELSPVYPCLKCSHSVRQ